MFVLSRSRAEGFGGLDECLVSGRVCVEVLLSMQRPTQASESEWGEVYVQYAVSVSVLAAAFAPTGATSERDWRQEQREVGQSRHWGDGLWGSAARPTGRRVASAGLNCGRRWRRRVALSGFRNRGVCGRRLRCGCGGRRHRRRRMGSGGFRRCGRLCGRCVSRFGRSSWRHRRRRVRCRGCFCGLGRSGGFRRRSFRWDRSWFGLRRSCGFGRISRHGRVRRHGRISRQGRVGSCRFRSWFRCGSRGGRYVLGRSECWLPGSRSPCRRWTRLPSHLSNFPVGSHS